MNDKLTTMTDEVFATMCQTHDYRVFFDNQRALLLIESLKSYNYNYLPTNCTTDETRFSFINQCERSSFFVMLLEGIGEWLGDKKVQPDLKFHRRLLPLLMDSLRATYRTGGRPAYAEVTRKMKNIISVRSKYGVRFDIVYFKKDKLNIGYGNIGYFQVILDKNYKNEFRGHQENFIHCLESYKERQGYCKPTSDIKNVFAWLCTLENIKQEKEQQIRDLLSSQQQIPPHQVYEMAAIIGFSLQCMCKLESFWLDIFFDLNKQSSLKFDWDLYCDGVYDCGRMLSDDYMITEYCTVKKKKDTSSGNGQFQMELGNNTDDDELEAEDDDIDINDFGMVEAVSPTESEKFIMNDRRNCELLKQAREEKSQKIGQLDGGDATADFDTSK